MANSEDSGNTSRNDTMQT